MQIICPECQFTREVDESKIPARSQVATCPKCQTRFTFRELPEEEFALEEPEAAATPAPEPTPEPTPKPAPEPAPKAAEPKEPAREKPEPAPQAQQQPRQPQSADEPVEAEQDERLFPNLPDREHGDHGSKEELWRRLDKMTPPEPAGDEQREASTYESRPGDRDEQEQQPIPGWNGEFSEDFPDPMDFENKDDDEDDETAMQVPPPFEQLDRYGFFMGLFMTIKLVLTSPRLFFSVMPIGGGLSKPLTFAILTAMIQSLAQFAWGVAGLMPGVEFSGQEMVPAVYDATNGMFELLLTPAFVALTLFFISGFYNLILKVLRSDTAGFEGTFRVVAYAYAPIVTGIFPMPVLEIMGGWMFVNAVWSLVLAAIGLKYVHKTSYGKVIPVLLLPLLVGMIIGLSAMQAQLPTM